MMGLEFYLEHEDGMPYPRERLKGKKVKDLPDFRLMVEPESGGLFELGFERLPQGNLRLYFEMGQNKKYFGTIWGLDSYLTAMKEVVEAGGSYTLEDFHVGDHNYMQISFYMDVLIQELDDVFTFASDVEKEITKKTHQALVRQAIEIEKEL